MSRGGVETDSRDVITEYSYSQDPGKQRINAKCDWMSAFNHFIIKTPASARSTTIPQRMKTTASLFLT
jgi:hypothetical protein